MTPDVRDRIVENLFEIGRRIPADQRSAFIDRECGSDAGLAQELRELLACADDTGDDSGTGGATSFRPPDRSFDLTGDTRIGPYQLIHLLGEGGFGVVYLSQQESPVRRRVAIKVLKPGMDSRQVLARFETERQALALMDHPGIARVLDAGETDAQSPLGPGRPYFVMELVEGRTITAYCDAQKLGIRERLGLFVDVCHAVQHAHQKGVIHRDVKPGNVLVTEYDGRPIPKVIDFGIAKALHQKLTDHTALTDFRQLLGTPEYMSPEQADLGALDIDTRSDIYSLGVVLYELLTGVTPFLRRDLQRVGFDEMRRIIRETPPPRPSTRVSARLDDGSSLSIAGEEPAASESTSAPPLAMARHNDAKSLARTLRGDLDCIMLKCLEKDRTRRYETVNDLAADVRRYLDGKPVRAAPPSRLYLLRKFVRRNRGFVIAATLVSLSLLAAVVGTTTFALRERQRARETERVADFQARVLSEIEVKNMGSRLREDILVEAEEGWQRLRCGDEEIESRRKQLREWLADTNFTNTAIKGLDRNLFERTLTALDQEFADQPLVKARLLQHFADTCRRLSLLDRAQPAQAEALRIRTQMLEKDDPERLTSLAGMARVLKEQEKWPDAGPYAREAWTGRRRVLGDDHPQTWEATHLLAEVLPGDESESILRALYNRQRTLLGENDPRTLKSLYWLGSVIFGRQDERFQEAAELIEASANKLRTGLPENDETGLVALATLSKIRSWVGRYDEAIEILQDVLPVMHRELGDDNWTTWYYTGYLAADLREIGRLAEAEPLIEDTVQALRRIRGENGFFTLFALRVLAQLRLDQGRLAEAETAADYAIAGWERRGQGGWGWDDKLILLRILYQTGDAEKLTEAETLNGALIDDAIAYGARDPRTLEKLTSLALNLCDSGRADAAEALARQAVEGYRTLTNSPDRMMDALAALAFSLRDTDRPEEALPVFEEIRNTRRVTGLGRHMLGIQTWVRHAECLMMLHRLADAEQELLECTQTYSSLGYRSVPIPVVKAFIKLYETWHAQEPANGHDAQAAGWRERLPSFAREEDPKIPEGIGD